MNNSLVAERYAMALLELSIDKGLEDAVYQDNLLIAGICKHSRDFSLFLKSPIIGSDKKKNIIREIFGNKVHPVTLAYLLILVRKKREPFIPLIAKKLIDFYKNYKNILTVQFKSPVLPDPDVRKHVVDLMSTFTKKEIDLNPETDESLIGGFVLSWEDKQYDASIRREIDNLYRAIARVNLYKKRL